MCLCILFVYRIFGTHSFLIWSMCHFNVATLLGRYFATSCTVSPSHDLELPFLFLWYMFNWTGWMQTNVVIWLHMFDFSCGMRCWSYVLGPCQFVDYFMFSEGTIHNPVFFLVTFRVVCLYLMTWTLVPVNNTLYSASHMFLMGITVLCVTPAKICPYLAVSGTCGNANFHSLVRIILPLFGIPTLI